jgi:hypothetical protein
MEYIKNFDSFLNENINEAKTIDKVQPIAREFLNAVKAEFKTDIEESQITKLSPKGFSIRAVIKDQGDKMYDWASAYTAKHKDDISGLPLDFKVSPAVQGRTTLWPADDKMYFDIESE